MIRSNAAGSPQNDGLRSTITSVLMSNSVTRYGPVPNEPTVMADLTSVDSGASAWSVPPASAMALLSVTDSGADDRMATRAAFGVGRASWTVYSSSAVYSPRYAAR